MHTLQPAATGGESLSLFLQTLLEPLSLTVEISRCEVPGVERSKGWETRGLGRGLALPPAHVAPWASLFTSVSLIFLISRRRNILQGHIRALSNLFGGFALVCLESFTLKEVSYLC